MNKLPFYLQKFTKLKRASNKGEKAPHKPILLLAILRLIETGAINENKIFITPELVAAFKDYWHLLVTGVHFTANFSLPFYHLRSEGFWHLHTYPGKEILLTASYSIKSFGQLKEAVWFAAFEDDLFELFTKESDRAMLQQALLQTYFPAAQPGTIAKEGGYTSEIENEILNEPAAVYRQPIMVTDEEEHFVRSALFKRLIPAVYNNTCCISRMQVTTAYNIQMIDACHIKPLAGRGEDSILNGIPLCPNLHRAFDRGLLTIGNNYQVISSPHFFEEDSSCALRQYEGVIILLPHNKQYFPAVENLSWHQQNIFKS